VRRLIIYIITVTQYSSFKYFLFDLSAEYFDK